MRKTQQLLKYIGLFILFPIIYIIISLILTYIPVESKKDFYEKKSKIYLSTNGVHLEMIIHKNDLDPSILTGQVFNNEAQFFSFGWGDKNFYVETPTWEDLTFMNGFCALFINTSALIHVTRYTEIRKDWIEIKLSKTQLYKLNHYINNTFRLGANNKKILLHGLGYHRNDDFYEANGNYNCFRTCNTWINKAFKESDIKACLWTPYDFGLLGMHQ